jgi:hypothetical protein
VLGGIGGVVAFRMTAGATEAGAAFLRQLAREGPEAAYGSTAAVFRAGTPKEAFVRLVRTYSLTDLSDVGWSSRSVSGDTATLSGAATLNSGTKVPIEMILTREDGGWRVAALTVAGGMTPLNQPRSEEGNIVRVAAQTGSYDDAVDALANGDYPRALSLLRPFAEQGLAQAQYNLGVLYNDGLGTPPNPLEAMRLFQLAAAQGNANAQNAIGVIYRDGAGAPVNPSLAAQWFRKAVAQGHAGAEYNLALLLDLGEGVAVDKAEAVRLYRLSAEQGNGQAQYNLAVSYAEGDGIAPDAVQAYKWFSLAARQSVPHASDNLGQVARALSPAQRAGADALVASFRAR